MPGGLTRNGRASPRQVDVEVLVQRCERVGVDEEVGAKGANEE